MTLVMWWQWKAHQTIQILQAQWTRQSAFVWPVTKLTVLTTTHLVTINLLMLSSSISCHLSLKATTCLFIAALVFLSCGLQSFGVWRFVLLKHMMKICWPTSLYCLCRWNTIPHLEMMHILFLCSWSCCCYLQFILSTLIQMISLLLCLPLT